MEDRSELLRGMPLGGLYGGESMLATNTTSAVPPFTSPGSDSESVRPQDIRQPGPHLGEPQDFRRTHAAGRRDPAPWSRADGGPWADAAEPDAAPGAGGPGQWRQA